MGKLRGPAELPCGQWVWALCIAILGVGAGVQGLPLLGLDLDTCRPLIPHLYTEAEIMECCLREVDKPVVDFQFEGDDVPMRVRRPAHKLTKMEVEKYERAYAIMRSLPAEDPRSWQAQMDLHCSYCSPTYHQINSFGNGSYTDMELFMVHRNWIVWPWHRWFLYFHERILGSLIDDPTFALPYWAWDVQSDSFPPENTIPEIFVNPESPLYDAKRSAIHVRPFMADLTRQDPETATNRDVEELKATNRYTMWRAMIADTVDPYSFYGGAFREGESSLGRIAGAFEEPHTAVHQWTGDETMPNWPDMGTAEWGAGDPIFFAHHSQVDRLWQMWKMMGGQDINDTDWFESTFLMYNENGELVKVNVFDSLDLEKLKITYDFIPVDWMTFTPESIRATNPKYAHRWGTLGRMWRQFYPINPMLDEEESLLTILARRIGLANGENKILAHQKKQQLLRAGGSKEVIAVQLPRPGARATRLLKQSSKPDSILQEVLVIEGIVTKVYSVDVGFNVFIDLPEADRTTTLGCVEALGNFYITSEGYPKANYSILDETVTHHFFHKMSMGPRYDILRIGNSPSVAVNLVSTWNKKHEQVSVELTKLSIELQVIGS